MAAGDMPACGRLDDNIIDRTMVEKLWRRKHARVVWYVTISAGAMFLLWTIASCGLSMQSVSNDSDMMQGQMADQDRTGVENLANIIKSSMIQGSHQSGLHPRFHQAMYRQRDSPYHSRHVQARHHLYGEEPDKLPYGRDRLSGEQPDGGVIRSPYGQQQNHPAMKSQQEESRKLVVVQNHIRKQLLSAVVFASAVVAFLIFNAGEVAAQTTAAVAAGAASAAAGAASAAAGAASVAPAAPPVDFGAILKKSASKALGGGVAGASAAVVQVLSLMWMRTVMNYQYRYGGGMRNAIETLMKEGANEPRKWKIIPGGIRRLYKGLPFALVQAPMARFGDTAANVGVLAVLSALPATSELPIAIKTAAASVAAGLWRIVCMPIDTSKTVLQVEGKEGFQKLVQRVKEKGPLPLYQGAIATTLATIAGNYPWFATYNVLDARLPFVDRKADMLLYLLRSAFLGLCASGVSDLVSNSLRVIKTTQQTAALNSTSTLKAGKISMIRALKLVLETDGLKGLFFRGLKTKLLTNAIQGALFSVLWRYFMGSPR